MSDSAMCRLVEVLGPAGRRDLLRVLTSTDELDTKKIGRMGPSAGWRFDRTQKGRHTRLGWSVVHVAIDDHSPLAYVEELQDERPETAVAFLGRALEFYKRHGITVRRV